MFYHRPTRHDEEPITILLRASKLYATNNNNRSVHIDRRQHSSIHGAFVGERNTPSPSEDILQQRKMRSSWTVVYIDIRTDGGIKVAQKITVSARRCPRRLVNNNGANKNRFLGKPSQHSNNNAIRHLRAPQASKTRTHAHKQKNNSKTKAISRRRIPPPPQPAYSVALTWCANPVSVQQNKGDTSTRPPQTR